MLGEGGSHTYRGGDAHCSSWGLLSTVLQIFFLGMKYTWGPPILTGVGMLITPLRG